ncbi:MAG: hypothetical protein IH623_04445 [Verrucomicrobia bacterium]|nr:hypothetical protein [Verrucomicrobiota bacterium]
MKSSEAKPNDSGLNSEQQLWAAADKMRGRLDAPEFKHADHRPGDMNTAAGTPVADPVSFKAAVINAPDRRSALRFKERCRLPRNAG